MTRILSRKLSKDLLGDFEDSLADPKEMPTLAVFEPFIIRKFNKLDAIRKVSEKTKKEDCAANCSKGTGNKTSCLLTNDDKNSRRERRPLKCGGCKGEGHITVNCPVLLKTENKSALLIANKWCLFCLKHPSTQQHNSCNSLHFHVRWNYAIRSTVGHASSAAGQRILHWVNRTKYAQFHALKLDT